MPLTYTLAGAALNQTPIHWQKNFDNIKKVITKAKNEQINFLCLPELCITGYGCGDLFLHPWVAENALNMLKKIVPLCQNITLFIGLPISFERKLYNCVAVVHNQNIQGFTPKQYLANEGIHYESRWFTAWKDKEMKNIEIDNKYYPFGNLIYNIDHIKIGIEICEDAWQENKKRPAYFFAQNCVNIIFNASASYFALKKRSKRKLLVASSAKKYNCIYVYTNLLGNEAGKIIYDGEVLIASPQKILAQGGYLSLQDYVLVQKRIPSKYNDPIISYTKTKDVFEDFTQALVLALFDYLCKSKHKKFVLSLSGGADSTACAVLVVEMVKRGIQQLGLSFFLQKLGLSCLDNSTLYAAKDKALYIIQHILICVYQKTKNSSEESKNAAQKFCNTLSIPFFIWNIDKIIDSYTDMVEQTVQEKMNWKQHDIALQNIQARSRVPALWMLANYYNALLINTSNRSESIMGYATIDGDMSGSLAPLGGIDKHFILQFLSWAEKELKYTVLKYVNALVPSAELRPQKYQQQDEEELMPYSILAYLEHLFVQKHLKKSMMINMLQKKYNLNDAMANSYVQKFLQFIRKSQWKRERMAPSFHIDDFSTDPKTFLRLPIFF